MASGSSSLCTAGERLRRTALRHHAVMGRPAPVASVVAVSIAVAIAVSIVVIAAVALVAPAASVGLVPRVVLGGRTAAPRGRRR